MTKGAPQGNSNAKKQLAQMGLLLKEIQLKPLQKSITLGATPSNALKNLSKVSMLLKRSREAHKSKKPPPVLQHRGRL